MEYVIKANMAPANAKTAAGIASRWRRPVFHWRRTQLRVAATGMPRKAASAATARTLAGTAQIFDRGSDNAALAASRHRKTSKGIHGRSK